MAVIVERKAKSGVTYRAIVRIAGYPPRTRTFKNRTQAKLWAQREEIKIRDGEVRDVSKEARLHTVGELIDAYSSDVLPTKGYHTRRVEPCFLKWWKERVGAYALSQITPEILSGFMRVLSTKRDRCREGQTTDTPRSKKTVKYYRDTLDRVFKKAVEWRWMPSNPMSAVDRVSKINNQRVRYLEPAERKALLDACRVSLQPYLHIIVVFALCTGARKGEILGLTVRDIDLKRGLATFRLTKNTEVRRAHLHSHLREMLEKHITSLDDVYGGEHKGDKWLFPRADASAPVDITAAWMTARDKAEIQDFRFHDLRHTAASYLAMNGATLLEIASVLGHRTLQMVKRYAHISEQHAAEVVTRMNERMFEEDKAAEAQQASAE